MTGLKKLSAEDLTVKFDFLPGFKLTTEISPFKEMIGQERAIEAIDMGLSIDYTGYNIFVCGINGTGKKSYAMKRIKEHAENFEIPNDWCYVYNFTDSTKPLALELRGGTVEYFKQDMDSLIDYLLEEVPKAFGREEFEKVRNDIIDKHQKNILNEVDKLYAECKLNDFSVKSTSEGFSFTPIYDGEEMTEKKYNELEEDEREKINDVVSELKLLALDVMRKSKKIKKELYDELKELDQENAISIINDKIEVLIDRYGFNQKIIDYLGAVREDIINNIEVFIEDEEVSGEEEVFLKRYYINIISSNKEKSGLPVVYESFPEYHNLIGRIEYESKAGNITTDFTSIRGGSLHKANGGYLIIDAYQLLTCSQSWEVIKRALKNEYINIENSKTSIDLMPIVSFKPEEIPLKIKVVLIGNPLIYYILFNNDEDFKELFKIKADFDYEIENNETAVFQLIGFISNYCSDNDILPVSKSGVYEILKFSLRKSESKKYFSSSMNLITDLLIQASSIAKAKDSKFIDGCHVKDYINHHNRRLNSYRDKVYNMYKDGKYLIDVKGSRIGEINGLTVIDHSDNSFGKQTRITVTTFAGKDGIINIERETSMSGSIHSKGILILSGYIGETFGQNMSLSFNASICFEQLYGEVDGDSASAAELIALLSSLGNIAIKQNIAITGSVNQRGDIQPVGGINEKIEGFFDICSFLGLSGNQGVIIPQANLEDLILKDEVIREVEKGAFHIYTVRSIEDCFEVLCDMSIIKGTCERVFDVVKKNVEEKLKKYNNVFSMNVKE